MNNGFGSEIPRPHSQAARSAPARYLVMIESGGYVVARLFSAERKQLTEFDGSTEEAAQMMAGMTGTPNAADADWDKALQGHSAQERAMAQVFKLEV